MVSIGIIFVLLLVPGCVSQQELVPSDTVLTDAQGDNVNSTMLASGTEVDTVINSTFEDTSTPAAPVTSLLPQTLSSPSSPESSDPSPDAEISTESSISQTTDSMIPQTTTEPDLIKPSGPNMKTTSITLFHGFPDRRLAPRPTPVLQYEPATTTTSTAAAATTTPRYPCVPDYDTYGFCRQQYRGFFSHPYHCSQYIVCEWGFMYVCTCAEGTHWDSRYLTCVWDYMSPCVAGNVKQHLESPPRNRFSPPRSSVTMTQPINSIFPHPRGNQSPNAGLIDMLAGDKTPLFDEMYKHADILRQIKEKSIK